MARGAARALPEPAKLAQLQFLQLVLFGGYGNQQQRHAVFGPKERLFRIIVRQLAVRVKDLDNHVKGAAQVFMPASDASRVRVVGARQRGRRRATPPLTLVQGHARAAICPRTTCCEPSRDRVSGFSCQSPAEVGEAYCPAGREASWRRVMPADPARVEGG